MATQRIYSLDLLRGAVMVIMALDHTRDFFHYDAFVHDPLNVATTTPALFFTRWITHFCAPIFVFLAGTSIRLQHQRKSTAELGLFLLKRGLWLLVVEFVLITYAWTFAASFPVVVMQVIAAIGFSMIGMALLIHLSPKLILALGLLMVLGHNVLDRVGSTHEGFAWDVIRNGSFVMHPIGAGRQLLVIYPILPWLGVMMLGYGAGGWFATGVDPIVRRRTLMRWGWGVITLFLALRASNLYGDPHPWMSWPQPMRTAMDFLNLDKYPPSLLYLCMTLGPGLLFLAFFERTDTLLSRAVSTFGRVPFFYYVLHFYLLHALCMVLFVLRGHAFSEPTPDIWGVPFRFMIVGEGYSLTTVYAIWLAVVLALYPVCVWFAAYKRRSDHWWLSYL